MVRTILKPTVRKLAQLDIRFKRFFLSGIKFVLQCSIYENKSGIDNNQTNKQEKEVIGGNQVYHFLTSFLSLTF